MVVINILFVITGLGMGGAETQVCNLADELAALGHEVSIIYLSGDKVVSPLNLEVKLIGLNLENNPLSLLVAFNSLRKLLKKIKPDVVHSHMVHANIITRLIRLFCKIPVLISSAHSSNEGGKFRMCGYKYTHRLSDLTTNVGEISVQSYYDKKAAPVGELISMVNGIDTNRFNPLECSTIRTDLNLNSSERLFLAVGRNDEAKDYSNLLKAVGALTKKAGFHVAIVGHNTSLLQAEIDRLRIQGKVTVLGLRRDVNQLMASADALVMSSSWEGLPIVIGEAMASGCNIVTTDAGGCREWLTEHESVVPTQNSEQLARAIENKLEQPDEEWVRISKANRQHVVDNFSIDGVVTKWLQYYKRPESAFDVE